MEVKVLCKDCHYKKVGESKLIKEWLWCKHHEVWCDETDYCSWGLPEKQYREEEASLYSDEEPEVPDKWVVDMERERRMERD